MSKKIRRFDVIVQYTVVREHVFAIEAEDEDEAETTAYTAAADFDFTDGSHIDSVCKVVSIDRY